MNMLRKGLKLFTSSRDFTLLMGVQFLAQAGDGIVQAALAKSIAFGGQKGFDIEGAKSPDELMRIALLIFVPYLFISPFLGVIIDRWDRRRLMFLANGLRGAVVLLIGIAGVGNVGELPLFVAFVLTLASSRVVLATKAAALPVVLENHSLVEGNAVSQLGGAVFQLGGAGFAVVATSALEVEPVVIAGALVYLAGAALAMMIKKAGEARSELTFVQEVGRVFANIADGIREVIRVPAAGAAISTYFWLRLLWSFSIVGIGFIAKDLLAGNDNVILVLTGGAGAVGAGLGFVMAARLTVRMDTPRLVLGASFVAGASVALLGAIELKASIALLVFFLGFGFFLAKISLDTMVQEALGDDFRGRAFSLYDISYNLAWVVAATLMKLWWTDSAQGALIAISGVVFLLGLFGIAQWFRRAGLLAAREAPVN